MQDGLARRKEGEMFQQRGSFSKKTASFLGLFLIVVMILGNALPVTAETLEEFMQRARELHLKQDQTESALKNIQNKAKQLETQLKNLSGQISAVERDLREKEAAYEEAIAEVNAAKLRVEQKQEELLDRQNTMRNRARAMYEFGQASYVEVVLQATDISDFLSRTEYLKCLVANDQNILAEVRFQKQLLEEEKIVLEEKMQQAQRLKEEAIQAQSLLKSKRNEQQVALSENKKYQDDLIQQIENMEKDSKALESKIRELQAERRKAGGVVVGFIDTWPTPGVYMITSSYGERIHPITRVRKLHTGIDIGARGGTKIVAAGDGVVIFAGWYGAYGNAVIIDHGNGMSTLYGHMSSCAVSTDALVFARQVIGYVGSTGWSTGPHLHFEIRNDGVPTNPAAYFNF